MQTPDSALMLHCMWLSNILFQLLQNFNKTCIISTFKVKEEGNESRGLMAKRNIVHTPQSDILSTDLSLLISQPKFIKYIIHKSDLFWMK